MPKQRWNMYILYIFYYSLHVKVGDGGIKLATLLRCWNCCKILDIIIFFGKKSIYMAKRQIHRMKFYARNPFIFIKICIYRIRKISVINLNRIHFSLADAMPLLTTHRHTHILRTLYRAYSIYLNCNFYICIFIYMW